MWRDRRDINIWSEPCRRYPLRTVVWMTWGGPRRRRYEIPVEKTIRDILMVRATGK